MAKRLHLARFAIALLIVAGAAVAIAVAISEPFAWRARVVSAKLLGYLPEVPAMDLVRWLRPGSPVHLETLAETPNAHAGIVNHLIRDGVGDKGREVFGRYCSHCHGSNARGGMGPDMVSSVANTTDWGFFSAVKWGRPGTSMNAQPLSDLEIWQTHAYLRGLGAPSGAEDRAGAAGTAKIDVPAESILAAATRPHEWLTYAGSYAGHRHSALSHISKANVAGLRVAWVAQLRSADVSLQASPIAAGGLLFVSESPDGVVALEAGTGRRVWRYQRRVAANLPLCCGSPNRGVAILGDSVFVATLDSHLVALDATTGRRKWETKVADPREGYTMTGAPLAIDGRVVVGVAGGDLGIRGFIAAFAAADGRPLWKFHTVPGPGEPGHETWTGDSWKTGGAPTWTTGAYDEKLGLVFWGTGNPAPVHQGDYRPGDNLYSNSMVALDAQSGKLRWHFQFTPADERDWDAVQQPVLAELSWQQKRVPALVSANRNGFFYALDRASGKFLFAKPFVKQTWADGLEATGRPIQRPDARPSRTGSLVWPWVGGGTNWWPPSYDAQRHLLYVPTVDAASIYFREQVRFEKGKFFMGSVANTATSQPTVVAIRAIDAGTGDIRWKTDLASGLDVHRVVGGVLSTAGGLVFGGYRDEFFAFDSDSGEKLWQLRLGGFVNAAPIAYSANDSQFIVIIAGHSLFAFALPPAK